MHFAAWPRRGARIDAFLRTLPTDWSDVGAVIVEPIQGRAGVRLPPPGFLRALKRLCRASGALLIVDEVLTGIGRCGAWWRAVDDGVVPDLICAGKALGGGLPISACIGDREVMNAWGDPDKEAIHTGTFYGDPLGAAAALATLELIEREQWVKAAAERGSVFAQALRSEALPGVEEVRQVGMLLGMELRGQMRALKITRALLERGYLVLPAGIDASVIQIAPAITIADAQLEGFVAALRESLEQQ